MMRRALDYSYGERWAPNRHCCLRLARHDWMQDRCIDCGQQLRPARVAICSATVLFVVWLVVIVYMGVTA